MALLNSGLSRFLGNIAPYTPTPYTPQTFSPPSLLWRAPSHSLGSPLGGLLGQYAGGGDNTGNAGYGEGRAGFGGFSSPSIGLSNNAGLIGGLLGGLPGAIGAQAALGPTSGYGLQAGLADLYGVNDMSLEPGSMAPGGSMSGEGGFDYGGMDTSGMDADAAEGIGGYDSGGGDSGGK